MEENLETLQSLLAERAEKRLNDDIEGFINKFREHKFFDALREVNIGIPGPDPRVTTVAAIFWNDKEYVADKLREVLLPKYIEEEARLFVDKVYNLDSHRYYGEEEEEEMMPKRAAKRKPY